MTSVTNLDDTRVQLNIHGDSVTDVVAHFQKLRTLAHQIETEPCTIHFETDAIDQQTIHAQFDFCCAAEKIIFELNYAFNSKYKH